MNDTHETAQSGRHEQDEGLDPRRALEMLEQTTRRARRLLDDRTPWLALAGAATILLALGSIWLSVRAQHPYKGPSGQALLFMYGVLFVWIIVVAAVMQRAHAGLSGRSIRQRRIHVAVVVVALVAVSAYQVLLKTDGVRLSVVYGTYPVTSQLIVLGTIGAIMAGLREDWVGFGTSIAIVLIAAGSAFAGPRGVWLSDAIGCAVAAILYGAARSRVRRR